MLISSQNFQVLYGQYHIDYGMILRTHFLKATHTGGRIRKGSDVEVGVFACDHCKKEFEKRLSQMKDKTNHFCSKRCVHNERKASGLVGRSRIETCKNRWGVSNTFQSPEKQAKARQTLLTTYGVSHSMHIPEVVQKLSQANIKRWSLMSSDVCTLIQEKRKVTCIKRYGVDHPMKSSIVANRVLQAMLDGGHLRSKGERLIERMLCMIFERENVQTQVWQNNVAGRNHPVDFYIKSHRLMIEFDGDYWHDRISTKIRDEEFNTWCVENKRKLVRISESELTTFLGRTSRRLPRQEHLDALITQQTLDGFRALINNTVTSIHVGTVVTLTDLQRMTTPPTTASDVKFEP